MEVFNFYLAIFFISVLLLLFFCGRKNSCEVVRQSIGLSSLFCVRLPSFFLYVRAPNTYFQIFTYVAPEFLWIFLDVVNHVLFLLFGCLSCNFSDLIACLPVLRTRLFDSGPT